MTPANLVPSAHMVTEVHCPPQNTARISSSQFEVSDPVNNEIKGAWLTSTDTTVFPSADVEREAKPPLTGCAPPTYTQAAPELVEKARPKPSVAASFVPSAEEAILIHWWCSGPPVGCHVEPESAEAYISPVLVANSRAPSAEEATLHQELLGAEVATQVEPEFVEV